MIQPKEPPNTSKPEFIPPAMSPKPKDRCTCSSNFQSGVCKWCYDQYQLIYGNKEKQ